MWRREGGNSQEAEFDRRQLIFFTTALVGLIGAAGSVWLALMGRFSGFYLVISALVGLIGLTAAIAAGVWIFHEQRQLSRRLRESVRKASADLFETEQFYQKIVEQAADLIYILDLDLRVMLLNPQAVEVFARLALCRSEGGILPDAADLHDYRIYLHQRLGDLFRREDWSFVKHQVDKALSRDSAVTYDHTVETVRGRQVHLSTSLIPIRDDEKRVIYILGLSRDITRRAEFDRRMYQTEKLASIGTLAAGVAHEINNPLAIILGFTDLLLEKFAPGCMEYEDLKIIEENAQAAQQVVTSLLGFSRISEGERESFVVSDAAQAVMSVMKHLFETRRVTLEVNIEENLPKVSGDPREFQQVLINILNNALAAVPDREGRIALTARTDGERVRIDISDNGAGIPLRDAPHLFDPFFTTKPEGEGTGLGLWLSYGIMQKMGGKIAFTSLSREDFPDKPSGTTFTLFLPKNTSKRNHP